jgi:hypothetical protein
LKFIFKIGTVSSTYSSLRRRQIRMTCGRMAEKPTVRRVRMGGYTKNGWK